MQSVHISESVELLPTLRKKSESLLSSCDSLTVYVGSVIANVDVSGRFTQKFLTGKQSHAKTKACPDMINAHNSYTMCYIGTHCFFIVANKCTRSAF